MRKLVRILARIAVVTIVLLTAAILVVVVSGRGKISLPVTRTAVFNHPEQDQFPPPLTAAGQHLVDNQGQVIRLRGLMPVDPSVLHSQNRFNRRFFARMAATGANVIRLPVHPHHWQQDPDYLWRYLDQAAAWSGELGLYLIVDWHSIGNVQAGTAPLMPELYSHTWEMSVHFWTTVAAHFQDTPHVLFEIFNEPQGILAGDWRDAATELVAVIRAQGATQPIIVGGLDYARNLQWVLDSPIPDGNVVYAAHIYPQHGPHTWNLYFGRVAESYPVLITEWGYMDENLSGSDGGLLNGDAASYGEPLMAYLDARGIGWTACWYDETWEPPMLVGDGPTNFGRFVLAQLAGG